MTTANLEHDEPDVAFEKTVNNVREKSKWPLMVSDFGNMLKAFIGSNYLTIAYAFTQSGILMGVILLTIIAAVTDHCCHLIVKCKYEAIKHVLSSREAYKSSPTSSVNGNATFNSEKQDEVERDLDNLKKSQDQMVRHLTYGDVGKIAYGSVGLFLVNACLLLTQFGFCVNYFIFIGNTIYTLFPSENTTKNYNDSTIVNEQITAENFKSQHIDLNISLSALPAYLPMYNVSEYVITSTSPDLRLLVLTPIPVFVGFAFLRDVRHLGFVSVGANVSIFIGSLVTLVYIIVGFSVSSDWELYKWATLPVFFGMVTSAFEGIGTILPIESSMEGNRHNFSPFLHGSIVILSMVLTTFGIVGYLRYGETTEQILNKNIPTTTAVGMAINICLLFGVILTFPLQIFPVIEISEIFIFGHGHQCDSTKKDQDNEDLEDGNIYGENSNAKLLPKRKAHAPDPVIMTLLNEVSSWKRNILRILIVLCAAGLAILLRDLFAYVSAFIGAIGSSVIAYILPCLFHLKLCWHKIGFCVRFKDICIIVFGTAASILSLYTTIKEVVEKF
ncbi:unnamed protein product [Lymnaea stagnalis]|uniref:Amino acid transporter transmembrane domain-containing protein n=1 Tax=Lymnaea stagnalis TaxID=6523 RepID=A0AAV2H6D5_LYMST